MPVTRWHDQLTDYPPFARHLVRFLWADEGRRPRSAQELADRIAHPAITRKRLLAWINYTGELPPPGLTPVHVARIAGVIGVPARQLLLDAGLADLAQPWCLEDEAAELPTLFDVAGSWARVCREVERRAQRAGWAPATVEEVVQHLQSLAACGADVRSDASDQRDERVAPSAAATAATTGTADRAAPSPLAVGKPARAGD